jgi:hypothetical protein
LALQNHLTAKVGLTPENFVALRESGADEIVVSLAEAIERLKPQAAEEVPVLSGDSAITAS